MMKIEALRLPRRCALIVERVELWVLSARNKKSAQPKMAYALCVGANGSVIKV